jgi:hypothetical protein
MIRPEVVFDLNVDDAEFVVLVFPFKVWVRGRLVEDISPAIRDETIKLRRTNPQRKLPVKLGFSRLGCSDFLFLAMLF